MSHPKRRVLVVDDEPLVRELTMRALHAEGFICTVARDGVEAQKLLDTNRYDVVVTDLRMPNRHGYSLAVELLASDDCPVLAVLTGVIEPKLAKDLIKRGADCVEFKPVNYDLFAAKIGALVERGGARQATQIQSKPQSPPRPIIPITMPQDAKGKRSPTSGPIDVQQDKARLSKLLPVSQAALEVFNMVSADAFEAQQVAAAIKRDASLAVDVLQLANCSLFNPSGKKIVEVEEAVVRIGQKRIGELALAASALTTFTANRLPWMDVDLAWRQSIAAGVAVELLMECGCHTISQEALFLSALMHLAGRIALGTLYPDRYQDLITKCREHNQPLCEKEKVAFRMSHTQFAARMLQHWHIPLQICEPLEHLTGGYLSLARLGEPLRSKTELVKLAVFIGRIAVGQWEPWDRVEIPSDSVSERLGIGSFGEVIEQTRSDLEAIVSWRLGYPGSKTQDKDRKTACEPLHEIAYCNLSTERFDFLAEIIPSMGIKPRLCENHILESDENVIINCVTTPPHRLSAHINPRTSTGKKLIVTDADNVEPYTRFGRVFSVPGSYGELRSAAQEMARRLSPKTGNVSAADLSPAQSQGENVAGQRDCFG